MHPWLTFGLNHPSTSPTDVFSKQHTPGFVCSRIVKAGNGALFAVTHRARHSTYSRIRSFLRNMANLGFSSIPADIPPLRRRSCHTIGSVQSSCVYYYVSGRGVINIHFNRRLVDIRDHSHSNVLETGLCLISRGCERPQIVRGIR